MKFKKMITFTAKNHKNMNIELFKRKGLSLIFLMIYSLEYFMKINR